jgi:hypothetical protein
MKSVPSFQLRVPVIARKLPCRHIPVRGNGRNRRRMDEKLKELSDEYGSEQLGLGLIRQVNLQVGTLLDQNLRDGSLPGFLEEELRLATREQCATTQTAIHPDCLNGCIEILNPTAESIESVETEAMDPSAEIEEETQNVAAPSVDSNYSYDGMKVFIQQLERLYENLILQTLKTSTLMETEEKTSSWLSVLAGAFASMQIKFINAAMENLKTMQENSGFFQCDQGTLEAMGEDERQNYLTQRDQSRQRFLTANNHYRVNLHLFSMVSRMLSEMFSLFSAPCRLRT